MRGMNHCNPWHPEPSGYSNLAPQNMHAFICAFIYLFILKIYIYIQQPCPPKKQISIKEKPNKAKQTNKKKKHPEKTQNRTWTYTENKAPQTITTINPLLKCWHPTWTAKEGRVKQLLFLFQTSWGRLINCICVSQWKASNQLCNM